MMKNYNGSRSSLKRYYILFMEVGLIGALSILVFITNINIRGGKAESLPDLDKQEIVTVKETVQTKQFNQPPPPPTPQIPIEVPNDAIVQEEIINLDAEISFNEPLDIPTPEKFENTPEDEPEEDFFVAVEEMPEMIGSLADLQKKISYPKEAIVAGIEGRVIVQFIVNEEGNVENPVIIRGIGGGCDEEALRVVKSAKFRPGRQRGIPVRVRYSLPIYFLIKD